MNSLHNRSSEYIPEKRTPSNSVRHIPEHIQRAPVLNPEQQHALDHLKNTLRDNPEALKAVQNSFEALYATTTKTSPDSLLKTIQSTLEASTADIYTQVRQGRITWEQAKIRISEITGHYTRTALQALKQYMQSDTNTQQDSKTL